MGAGAQVRLGYCSAPDCGHGATVGAKQLCVQNPAGCGKEGQEGMKQPDTSYSSFSYQSDLVTSMPLVSG